MTTAIRPYEVRDRDSLVALWDSCDLTRAWNDPGRDIDRKLANDAQNLLILERAGDIIGSVMVGYDGHRGWINYLAVHASHQRQGFARQLMAEAERRLREVGCAKVNLQVQTPGRATSSPKSDLTPTPSLVSASASNPTNRHSRSLGFGEQAMSR